MKKINDAIARRKYEILSFASLLLVSTMVYYRVRTNKTASATLPLQVDTIPQQSWTQYELKQMMNHLSARDYGLIMLGAALRSRLGKMLSVGMIAGDLTVSHSSDAGGIITDFFRQAVSVLPSQSVDLSTRFTPSH